MDNKRDKKLLDVEMGEDTTKYGEFIASFHSWITPDQQRKSAKKLENPGSENAQENGH